VFDAVGTLIYPHPAVPVAYYEFGRQHGSRLTHDDIARNFSGVLKRRVCEPRTNEQIEHRRWRYIVAEVFSDLDETESLFRQLWSHFARSSSWAVYDDVPDVLTELNSLGVITAIGSNFDDRLIAIASELSPLDQMRATFVSSRVGFTKPSIEFFRAIEAKLQLHPSQLLMIGDEARNDREGAAQAGWHSLLLNRGATGSAKGVIQSLREITRLWA
jgi:putative hydrolase of the HAD superfamily